jgi:hypothetical protein
VHLQEVASHRLLGMEQNAQQHQRHMHPPPEKDSSSNFQDGASSADDYRSAPACRLTGMRPVCTGIAVESFANHRNMCDHIVEHLQDPVDELQSPLKGSRRTGELL